MHDIQLALRGAFFGKGWHGPSVLEAVKGLTAKKARKRRGKASHSIHELIDHVEHWEAVAIHYVRRGKPPKRHRKDWGPPNLAFRDSVRRLRATHRVLVAALGALEDADLERPVRTVGVASIRSARCCTGWRRTTPTTPARSGCSARCCSNIPARGRGAARLRRTRREESA